MVSSLALAAQFYFILFFRKESCFSAIHLDMHTWMHTCRLIHYCLFSFFLQAQVKNNMKINARA